MSKDRLISFSLFLFFIALYIVTAGGWVVPYRDAGEMSSVLATMGVAHPPGYPFYTLLGRLFMELPLGNLAYRAGLFSAFAGAVALPLLYLLLRTWTGILPSLAGALFLGFSRPYWELSLVSEMYALGILMLTLILLAALRWRQVPLTFFLLGLTLGVRMDFLLLIPVFVIWFWFQPERKNWVVAALVFSLGASVFLYLPIRSATDPVVDWGNPEGLSALLSSVTRKSYGGTLDLLSLSYRKGENFGINLLSYGRHLIFSFGMGCVFMLIGVVVLIRQRWKEGYLFGSLFLIMGPLFLFLANMPPNPHSMAIVEASYLPIDFFAVFFLCRGVSALLARHQFQPVILMAVFVGSVVSGAYGYPLTDKRHLLAGRDAVENAFRSLPRNAIGVFHDDVQLFSLWHAQLIDRRRLDVGLVASGLSASPWYWSMMERWGSQPAPRVGVKDAAGWQAMRAASGGRPLLAGYDTTISEGSNLNFIGAGALVGLKEDPHFLEQLQVDPFQEVLLFRERRPAGATPDFFSSDLVTDKARALHQFGLSRLLRNMEGAEKFLLRAGMMDSTFARPFADLGYLFFVRQRYGEAEAAFRESVRRGHALLEQARQYKALPEAVMPLRTDLSGAYVSWGGAMERLGNKEAARKNYETANQIMPNAQAHYNLAVSKWGTDWNSVVSHLQQALRLNPGMTEAQKYLAVAMTKRETR